jgi:hypothetical protein
MSFPIPGKLRCAAVFRGRKMVSDDTNRFDQHPGPEAAIRFIRWFGDLAVSIDL